MPNSVSLAELLTIDYPVIQAPMLGVTTSDMVAAIANAGGLGSLPVGGLSPEKTAELIRETKRKTSKPFAVNLFAHEIIAQPDNVVLAEMQDFLATVYADYQVPFERKAEEEFRFYSYLDQLDVLIDEQIPIVSFTFGMLNAESVDRLKSCGATLIGTATSVREAQLLSDSGVNAIVAQGFEAGGHRGTFCWEGGLPQVGLFSLLPQMADAVSVPVIAAGGIVDARTVNAAFVLGAAGVQLGTFFIPTEESAASEAYRKAVLEARDTSTKLTKAFTGRWARGIRNEFMARVETSGLETPYYTYQNNLTAPLRAFGQKTNQSDLVALWAGQSAVSAQQGKSRDVFLALIEKIKQVENPPF
ncbi:nitronate monooxygenase family protein [Spirosoma daeguense]